MFSRRRFISILSALGISTLSLKNISAQKKDSESDLPPHNEALSPVWNTQQKFIREAEISHAKKEQRKVKEYVSAEGRRWFDTDNRKWKVWRPTPPGGIDTTHEFVVSYLIEDKEVARWFVNTEDKIVEKSKS